MLIIIEGTDNVGKTTQANLIKERMKDRGVFHVVHYSSLPFKDKENHIEYSHSLYEDMFDMMDVLNKYGHNVIFDRSHLGESVYAPLYRGYSGDFIFDIEKESVHKLSDSVYLITLVNDPKLVMSRDDGFSFYTNEQEVQDEVDGFIRAHRKSIIKNKLLINVGDMGPTEVSDHIFEFLTDKTNF
jgi:thymidylate kinase